MFRLVIEIDVPTNEEAEAQLVADHLRAQVERGLGFSCHTRWYRMSVDHSHFISPHPPNIVASGIDIGSHRHSYYAGEAEKDEHGNWVFPAHSHSPAPISYQFSEEEKQMLLSAINDAPPNQEDFLDEEDMKI